jgi:prepilin-type N-terminal cleavage/methylation domain-containing protein
MTLRTPRRSRAGFTLIELLVVMGLILLLVGITLSISYSGLIDNYKTVGAGDRASGWLLIQKSRATREGAPRGVRFFFDGNQQCKEAQYIEVPEPYIARNATPDRARIMISQDASGNRTVKLLGADTADLMANVQAGDFLSIPEYGVLLQIVSLMVNSAVAPTDVTVTVASPWLLPAFGMQTAVTSTTFGFPRKARPMLAEPILLLTDSNAIEGINCSPQVGANTNVDVLFAPGGEVVNAGSGKIIFFVRNPSLPPINVNSGATTRQQYEAAGSMNLVTIYSKTGSIATHPVKLPQGGPNATHAAGAAFDFTRDGFNTGL